jgi:hypothetical protein
LNTKVTVTGVREIDQVLRGLPLQINHRVMQAAHADAATPMVERAKTLSPNGRTFHLEQSIGVVKSSYARSEFLGEISVGPRRGSYKGHHAHLIEYGTKPRTNKAGAFRGSVKPKPFMQPAFQMTKDLVLSRIADSVGKKLLSFMRRTIKNA